jgi:hypothetical protein
MSQQSWFEKLLGISWRSKLNASGASFLLYEEPKSVSDYVGFSPAYREQMMNKIRQLEARRRFKNNRRISNIGHP